jgi:hypothetical protein
MSEKFSVENRHVPGVKCDESVFTSRFFTIEKLPVQPKTHGFGEALPGAFFPGGVPVILVFDSGGGVLYYYRQGLSPEAPGSARA